MKRTNIISLQKHVSTQYGDLTGIIQLDGHMNISELYTLCEDYNFSTEDIFIIGFGLSESTINGIGQTDSVFCSILFVHKSAYGNTYDEINKRIKNYDTLRIQRKTFSINYTDLHKYIKRFDFLAVNGLIDNFEEIEIEDVED